MLGGTSISALVFIATACFFTGQVSVPRQGLPVEIRCTCSKTAEVTSQFTLVQDEPRVWWYAALGTFLFALAGGLLCGVFAAGVFGVSWWNRISSKPEEIFVREPIPLRLNRNALRS